MSCFVPASESVLFLVKYSEFRVTYTDVMSSNNNILKTHAAATLIIINMVETECLAAEINIKT